jgi:hypothetical protein
MDERPPDGRGESGRTATRQRHYASAHQARDALLNGCSGFSCGSGGTFRRIKSFALHLSEEDIMRKIGFVIAALGALAMAVPSIASAETVVIKGGGHHHGWYGARAQMHHDRGWHNGWRHRHADKVVIIKKQRYHRY